MRTRIRRRALPVLAVAVVLTVAGVLLNPASAQFGDVVQFDTGSLTKPTGITLAHDGGMWFVDRGTNAIGHITVGGDVTLTPIGNDNAGPWGVVVGPDGAVWFTERQGNAIGRYDLDTGVVVELPLPALSRPNGIAAAGGFLWAAERAGRIARIDPSTHDIHEIGVANAEPFAIAAAPDGSLWFTDRSGGRVVRLDPATEAMDTFSTTSSFSDPRGIDVAADGTVWFTEWFSGKLGRLDPSTGTVVEIPIPQPDGVDGSLHPSGMTVGPGGVWVALEGIGYAARYKPATGTFDEFPMWAGGEPLSVVTGPDGNLWFTQPTASLIARVEAPDTTKPTIDLVSPADDASFVQDDAVTAEYRCDDEHGGSGLASCEGTVPSGDSIDTSTPGDFEFSVTATDNEGNTRTKTVAYHVLKPKPKDTTAPTITISSPGADATYVLGDRVRADYDCVDEDGGSGLVSCSGPVPDGDTIDTSSAGEHTFAVEAEDASGNASSASVTYTVETPKPSDTTPPDITLQIPQDGAAFMVGDRPLAAYSCADRGGSGLTSCGGPVASGGVIDTSSPGIFSFTVRASDAAGNRSSVTDTYVVFKDWGGKLELPPAVNEVTAGSAVPVWFNLGDAAPASIRAATSPATTPIDCTTHEPTGPTVPASVSPTGSKGSNGRVMYVWKTDKAWAGSCRAFTLGIAAPTTLYLHLS